VAADGDGELEVPVPGGRAEGWPRCLQISESRADVRAAARWD
jgi:hypothetical protein